MRRRRCRKIRNAIIQSHRANFAGILNGLHTLCGVYDESDLIIFQHINNIWPALINFINHITGNTRHAEPSGGTASGNQSHAGLNQQIGCLDHLGRLIGIANRYESAPAEWQLHSGTHLRLEKRPRKAAIPTHDFAGRAHLGTKDCVNTGKARKRHHRFFNREPRHIWIGQGHLIGHRQHFVVGGVFIWRAVREIAQRLSRHQARRD